MLNTQVEVRENPETKIPPVTLPTIVPITTFGIRAAAMELYDASLRIVELANEITCMPGITEALGSSLLIRLTTTRFCAQQALDKARVNS